MDTLRQDVRYALRSLAKAPGFTLIVVLTLALGIGANTAIFSVVNGILLRPLPYHQPERIAIVREIYGDGQQGSVSGPNYLDWRARNRSFEVLSAYRTRSLTVLGDGDPEEVRAGLVTSGFFRMLGVPLAAGREFSPDEEEGPGSVAIIGDGLWRTRFAADPGVIGRTLTLSGRPYTIVGIAPAGFSFPGQSQLWVPAELGVGRATERSSHSIDVLGRLKPGVTLEAASADLARVAGDLAREFPVSNAGRSSVVIPLLSDTIGAIRPALLMLSGAVLFVLFIACANVANLFLARASARQREMALRSALGASRWRLGRQVLVEAAILAGAGGIVGLLFASWGVELLLKLQPRGIPRLQEIAIDGTTLAYTLAVSLLVGIGFGIFPAIALSGHDPADSFRGEGRGSSEGRRRVRFRNALVVVQVSLALMLLVGAALLIVTVRRLGGIEPGFEPDRAMVFQMPISATKYPDQARHAAFIERMVQGLETVSGVTAVGAVYYLPLGSGDVSSDFRVEGTPPPQPGKEPYAGNRMVSGDFFAGMGLRVRRGRALTAEDQAGTTPVAVINETFAQRYLSGVEPLGKRVTFGDGTEDPVWMEIVGVVADVRSLGLTTEVPPEIYAPFAQVDSATWTVFATIPLSLVVRSTVAPETLGPAIRAAVREVDPEQVVSQLRPAGELVSGAIARQRFSMLLLVVFGGLALTLAGVGVYGVLAYMVSHRTRELGIRLALGARTSSVRALVLRQGLGIALLGVGIGLAGALALSRLLTTLLFEVSPTDPRVLAAAAATLCGVAGLACLIPAIRATRVDPIDALRSE
jgi:predicted permease